MTKYLPSVAAIGGVELELDFAARSTVADGQERVHGRDFLLVAVQVVILYASVKHVH